MINRAFAIFMSAVYWLMPSLRPNKIAGKFVYKANYPMNRGPSGVRVAKREARKRKNKAFMKRTGKL